jgi:predicted phage terminase large subunit-like protein
MAAISLKPQPGPQEAFLSSSADVVIYGGAAGGGKSWALLLEPLRHIQNPDFGAVIFRRTMPQITNEGGLWDESLKTYAPFAQPVTSPNPQWRFPSGAKISFRHLEHDKNVNDWQGSQIPLIMFDELTHFTEHQFWYMMSRNRSKCGVNPYIRATCNPDPDSFVARLIKWWIDPETGYAIPERSGVIRYMLRVAGEIQWADTAKELEDRYPESCFQEIDGEPVRIGPKSFTFIHSSVEDNKELLRVNPEYLANLNSLPTTERERLKKGNWKIRDERTIIFKPSWWRIWPDDKPLPNILHVFASWDTAFTAADQRIQANGKPPDQSKIAYSACTVWGVWLDAQDCDAANPNGRHKLILLSSWWGRVDWPDLKAKVEEIGNKKLINPSDAHLIEKAASGHSVIQDLRKSRKIRCRVVGVKPTAGDARMDAKVLRAYLFQPYLKDGYVWAPNKPWAHDTITWIAAFPGGEPPSADLADTMSMAGQHLTKGWWIHHPDDDMMPETSPALDTDDIPDTLDAIRSRGNGRGYGLM